MKDIEDFDLYKNITKKVHKHVPKLVIKNKIFNSFIVNISDDIKNNIINVDNIPKCTIKIQVYL